jgi:hypothetical protein
LWPAADLMLDPPHRLLADLDGMAGGGARLPSGRGVEPTIAGRAEPHLTPIDGPHYTPSVGVGWRARSSRTTRSTETRPADTGHYVLSESNQQEGTAQC